MAMKHKPKTSLFLTCFGCSKIKLSLHEKPPLEAKLSNTHVRKRWFSWPRFRSLKPSAIKTVPLVVQLQHCSSENETKKTTSHCKYKNKFTKSKSKPSDQTCINHGDQQLRHLRLQDLPLPQKDSHGHGHGHRHGHGDTNLGNAEKLEEAVQADAKMDDTCPFKRFSYSRTNDDVKTALTRTSSFSNRSPRVSSVRPAAANTGNESSGLQQSQWRKSKKLKNRGSGVGISMIVMVILTMVILCGRLYAILCTSAWFYFLPRLRLRSSVAVTVAAKEKVNSKELTNSRDEHEDLDLDLDSKHYKKKVILEGLLERNHGKRVHRL